MEAEDPLSQLADIHLPDTVAAWPPAPGWWVLAVLVLLALAVWLRRALVRLMWRRRQAYALRELDQVLVAWHRDGADPATRNTAGLAFLHGCNAVLKRVALVFYPGADVANLTDAGWLAFLDRVLGGNAFREGPGRSLGDGVYRPTFDADPDALHALCHRWVVHCYRHSVRTPGKPVRRKPVAAPEAGV